jgi:hypothetical protein
MLIRALVVWFLLLAGAVLNGAVREAVIIPRTGDYRGHVISTLMLSLVIILIACATLGWIGPAGAGDAVVVGLLWVVLTVAFEFLAGHYLFGSPWERLLADYNVARGRIWPLVLIVTFFAPRIAVALRGLFIFTPPAA